MGILLLPIGCEEKLPSLPLEQAPLQFRQFIVPLDTVDVKSIPPRLGRAPLLYVGQDASVSAFVLLRFANLAALPDPLDSLISVTLNLQTFHQYREGEDFLKGVEISLAQLENEAELNWVEDSTTSRTLSRRDLQLAEVDSFIYQEEDTISVPLDSRIVLDWVNKNKEDYSFVLLPKDTTVAVIQTLYSRDEYYTPWLAVSYQDEGDTVAVRIAPTADLSIIKFTTVPESGQPLQISSGIASHVFLQFELEKFLTDSNAVIAKAYLNMAVDPVNTRSYGELIKLYLTAMDSAKFGHSDYDPTREYYDISHSVEAGDSVAVIDIKTIIQQLSSGYRTNNGLVLWSPPSGLNIATLGIYDKEGLAPYLEIITMKED